MQVYALQQKVGPGPILGHVVWRNLWLNGSLTERGLAKVSARREPTILNTGRPALLQLQDEARYHERGIWENQR